MRDLKGQCHEIFSFWFFDESVSPQPLSIALGTFRIFSIIRGDIRKSRCTTGINNTCSARDWERSGLLEGIPKAVVQISALL